MRLLISNDEKVSIRKQCRLMQISRPSIYCAPKGESQENLRIMEKMDQHIFQEPTAGVLTMQSMLLDHGISAGYERIRRLMRLANIRPIYPRRHLYGAGKVGRPMPQGPG